jgi:hypothetical protein
VRDRLLNDLVVDAGKGVSIAGAEPLGSRDESGNESLPFFWRSDSEHKEGSLTQLHAHWPTKSFAVWAQPACVNANRRIGKIEIQHLVKGSFDMGRFYSILLAANPPTIQDLALHSSRLSL